MRQEILSFFKEIDEELLFLFVVGKPVYFSMFTINLVKK